MIRTSIYEKWFSINEKLKNEGEDSIVLEQIFVTGNNSVIISNDNSNNKTIYVGFRKDELKDYQLEKLRSIDIAINEIPHVSDKDIFLVFKLLDNDLEEAFMAFSAMLVNKIYDSKSSIETEKKIKEVIDKFRNFLKGTFPKLTINAEQGLFCELIYLNELIDIHGEEVVLNWTGPERNKFDFLFSDNSNTAIEVKSSTDQKGMNISISSEIQLDYSLVDNLYLKVYIVERIDAGNTIVDLINKILKRIEAIQYKKIFISKLNENNVNYITYSTSNRFFIVKSLDFVVNETFPMIIQSKLHSRITNVKYQLSLIGIEEAKFGIITNKWKNSL